MMIQGTVPNECFLPHKAHGTTLITSTKTAAANLVGGHGHMVKVEPMGKEDALALLCTRGVPFDEASLADVKMLARARADTACHHSRLCVH